MQESLTGVNISHRTAKKMKNFNHTLYKYLTAKQWNSITNIWREKIKVLARLDTLSSTGE